MADEGPLEAGSPGLAGPEAADSRVGWLPAWAVVLSCLLLWQVEGWFRWIYWQTDIFWLVETGRYIVEHGAIPQVDSYSFTSAGAPWVVYQWLFEVVAGLVQTMMGWQFLSFVVVGLVAQIFFVWLVRFQIGRGGNALVAAAVASLAVAAAMPDVVAARPQVVTFALLACLQAVLEPASGKKSASGRGVLWLGALMLVWVNTHVSFVVEIAVLSVYAACALVGRARAPAAPRRYLLGALGLAAVASFANPHGAGIYSFLFASWRDYNLTPELRPLDLSRNVLLGLYLLLSVVALAAGRGRLSVASRLVSLLLLAAAFAAARFVLYYIVWTAPLAGLAFSDFLLRARPDSGRWLPAGAARQLFSGRAYPLVVSACVAAMAFMQPVYFPSRVPVAAAEYLAMHPGRGRLFCSENAGSYLIWKFHGALKVFIDTRADLYGSKFCGEYRRAMLEAAGWQAIMDRWQIERALLPNQYPLKKAMQASGQWQEIYADAFYTLFARRARPGV